MFEDDPLDPDAGKKARDAALARVKANAALWFGKALFEIRGIPAGTTGVFEHFKLLALSRGLPPPPNHHNAWGAVAKACYHEGWLEFAGYLDKTKARRSHAREGKVIRRTRKP